MSELFMVFDCESVGLHGDTFAVGFVVVDRQGTTHAEGCFYSPHYLAEGTKEGRDWVTQHVRIQGGISCLSVSAVREGFWKQWLHWKEQGAVLIADRAWPVEARFLAKCVDFPVMGLETREFQGPFPLHEVATARFLAGFDPLATVERLPDELPAHDPLCDARQSARLWLEAINR